MDVAAAPCKRCRLAYAQSRQALKIALTVRCNAASASHRFRLHARELSRQHPSAERANLCFTTMLQEAARCLWRRRFIACCSHRLSPAFLDDLSQRMSAALVRL